MKACFTEGIILEVVGSYGVLLVDVAEHEITKSLLKDEKEVNWE